MGDVAMTVPVLRAFSLQHPEVTITVVSRPFFKPIFDTIPSVHFFAIDVKKRHKGLAGLWQLYKDLKPLQIDAVADLHNVLRSKVVRTFFKLNGKKVAHTDKGRADKKALTRAENKVFQPVKSMFERHVDTFAQLGFAVDLSAVTFPEKQALPQQVIAVTEAKNEKWIGIAPFAQYQSKVYPKDLMQQVIAQLYKEANYKLFLFGAPNEITALQELQQNLPNVTIVAGKLNFTEELQLIQHLDVMLSMDSGNAHLAAMQGVQVVTLWGATHPYAGFLPFHQELDSALTADRTQYPLLPTSVYGNKEVIGYADAMRTIAPESVVSKIKAYTSS